MRAGAFHLNLIFSAYEFGCGREAYKLSGQIIRLLFMFCESEDKSESRQAPAKKEKSYGQQPFEVLRDHRTKRALKRQRRNKDQPIPMEVPASSQKKSHDDGESQSMAMSSGGRRGRGEVKGKQYSAASMSRREIRIRFSQPRRQDQDERQAQLWKRLMLPEIRDFHVRGMTELAAFFPGEWMREEKPKGQVGQKVPYQLKPTYQSGQKKTNKEGIRGLEPVNRVKTQQQPILQKRKAFILQKGNGSMPMKMEEATIPMKMEGGVNEGGRSQGNEYLGQYLALGNLQLGDYEYQFQSNNYRSQDSHGFFPRQHYD